MSETTESARAPADRNGRRSGKLLPEGLGAAGGTILVGVAEMLPGDSSVRHILILIAPTASLLVTVAVQSYLRGKNQRRAELERSKLREELLGQLKDRSAPAERRKLIRKRLEVVEDSNYQTRLKLIEHLTLSFPD